MAFTTLKDLGVKNNPYSKDKYDNYINGKWVKPVDGQYFEILHPFQVNLSAKLQDLMKKISI